MSNDTTHVEIGKRIKELRKVHNLTREQLAEKAEISTKFLYEVEMGRKGLSVDSLLKIAKTLACSCDYLLTGKALKQENYDEAAQLLVGFEEGNMIKITQILALMHEMCDKQET